MRETKILRGLRRGQVLHAANGLVLPNSGIGSFSIETPSLMQPMSLRRAFAGMPNRATGAAYNPTSFSNTAGAGQGLRGQETVPMGMPNRPTGAAYNPTPATPSVAPKPVGAPPTPGGLQGASTALPSNFFGDAAGQYAAQGRSNGRPTAETEGVLNNLVGMQEARQAQAKASLTPTMMPDNYQTPQTMGRGLKDPSQPVSTSAQTMHDPVPAAPEPVGLRRGVAKLRGPGTTTSDSIPAKLSKGEAVLPAKTVQAMGADNVARLITSTNGAPPASGLRAGGGYNEGVIPPEADVMGAKAQDLNRPTGAGPTYRAGTGAERIATAADEAAAAARQAATSGGLGGSTASTATQAPKPEGLKAKVMQGVQAVKAGLSGAADSGATNLRKVGKGLLGVAGTGVETMNVAKDITTPGMSRSDQFDRVGETLNRSALGYAGVKLGAKVPGPWFVKGASALGLGAAGYMAPGLFSKLTGGTLPSEKAARLRAASEKASTKAPAGSLAAGQAATDEAMPQVQRPAQLNDIRNVDHEAGTMQVFSAAHGTDGKPVWQTVSTPEAKEARGLREAAYKQQLDHDAAASRADTARQLAYFQAQNGTDGGGESSAVRTLGDALRAGNLTKSGAALLQGVLSNQTSMNTARMSNAATLRGQDMTANTAAGEQDIQRRGQDVQDKGNELQFQTGQNRLSLDRFRMNYDVRQAADKGVVEDNRNSALVNSTDKDGKSYVDEGKVNFLNQQLNAMAGRMITPDGKPVSLQELRARGDGSYQKLRSAVEAQIDLGNTINNYAGENWFGAKSGWAAPNITNVREMSFSDWPTAGAGARDAALARFKPGYYSKGVEVDVGGRKQIIPIGKLLESQYGGEHMNTINTWRIANGFKPLGNMATGE